VLTGCKLLELGDEGSNDGLVLAQLVPAGALDVDLQFKIIKKIFKNYN
jgi:hypothetical protein